MRHVSKVRRVRKRRTATNRDWRLCATHRCKKSERVQEHTPKSPTSTGQSLYSQWQDEVWKKHFPSHYMGQRRMSGGKPVETAERYWVRVCYRRNTLGEQGRHRDTHTPSLFLSLQEQTKQNNGLSLASWYLTRLWAQLWTEARPSDVGFRRSTIPVHSRKRTQHKRFRTHMTHRGKCLGDTAPLA